ncbi:hypothetical protein BN13_1200004 [Nostocoides jenkinsii Ben 74]|uniref:Uncharacterized protein n=1 Tax=Nostocoides jenkinsii Ben 74 TaxID=1193518 RepID=A0A077M594_9MICO|nr:hypothetical protein BN13_1200004 [Tetrasphaera jenkinsii Ben 74]
MIKALGEVQGADAASLPMPYQAYTIHKGVFN